MHTKTLKYKSSKVNLTARLTVQRLIKVRTYWSMTWLTQLYFPLAVELRLYLLEYFCGVDGALRHSPV